MGNEVKRFKIDLCAPDVHAVEQALLDSAGNRMATVAVIMEDLLDAREPANDLDLPFQDYEKFLEAAKEQLRHIPHLLGLARSVQNQYTKQQADYSDDEDHRIERG